MLTSATTISGLYEFSEEASAVNIDIVVDKLSKILQDALSLLPDEDSQVESHAA